MIPKYIKFELIPGHIRSRSDGQRHYIDYNKLIKCYGLPRIQCYNYELNTLSYTDNVVTLYPLVIGNYKEVLAKKIFKARIKHFFSRFKIGCIGGWYNIFSSPILKPKYTPTYRLCKSTSVEGDYIQIRWFKFYLIIPIF